MNSATDTQQKQPQAVEEQSSTVRDFYQLLKPRVMSLVVFSGVVGMYLAPGAIHPLMAVVAVLCIAVGSGASGAINMWYERDIDQVMNRTQHRPIPTGKILPAHALEFGVMMALASVVLMYLATNIVAAGLLLAAILFYVFIYTIWLKRRTPQNIVIGGAAGAFPPMIGWAAVTGDIAIESFLMFAIIFMWTPPHFWALALYRNEDYTKAGIPMLPVVAGQATTIKHMLVYTLLLVALSLVPSFIGMSGIVYAVGAGVLGLLFIKHAVGLYLGYTEKKARGMFFFSLIYLFGVLTLLVIDQLVGKF